MHHDVPDQPDAKKTSAPAVRSVERALKSPYWKKTAAIGRASTIMIAVSGAARKIRTRRLVGNLAAGSR